MKTAFFSDIHGNFEALSAVLADARSKGVGRFVCLGDIVGYGPDPALCVEEVQALGCLTVLGNHDYYAAGSLSLDFIVSDLARISLEWTRNQLPFDQKEWLGILPLIRTVHPFMAVHSCPRYPEEWRYVFTREEAAQCLRHQAASLCFIGHTHEPSSFILQDGMTHQSLDLFQVIDPDTQMLVNVGSVGQPRNGDTRASYVIVDQDFKSLEYQRVDYDIEKTQERIRKHGLPDELAARLTDAV